MPDIVSDERPATEYTAFLGVDPGVGGGLAILFGGGRVVTTPMPKSEMGVWSWVNEWRSDGMFACIELVGGYIKRDGGNPGSAMFTFGQSYGALRMALVAAGIPFEAVRPQVWQKKLGILPRIKGSSAATWKGGLQRQAQRLYPALKVTKKTADALLIATYARMKWGDNQVIIP